MIIPLEQLSTDTLTAIMEDFILREGTEYGAEDVTKEDKIAQVKNAFQFQRCVVKERRIFQPPAESASAYAAAEKPAQSAHEMAGKPPPELVRGQAFDVGPRYTGLTYIGEGAYGMVW